MDTSHPHTLPDFEAHVYAELESATFLRPKKAKLSERGHDMTFRQFLGAFALFTIPAAAHHSFGAEYDANKPITLTGVVTKVEWTNPHSYFFIDVKDEKGNVANWKLEGYPPGVLYRTGWKRDVTIKPGDTVTTTGWQARDGTNWAHSRQVTVSGGKKLFWGPPAGTGDGGNNPAVEVK